MDNIIKIDSIDEENTNILLLRLVERFRREKHRLLTDREKQLCWWNILGVVMRDGYEAGKEYVCKVPLSD